MESLLRSCSLGKPQNSLRNRDALNELWDTLGDKPGEFVLPKLRMFTNLNPQLGRIIRRAGLKVWPKRWQNLRATRATELERHFSSHKVTKWCGHTERISKEHYWMTTDEDYDQAASHGSGAYLVQQSVVSGGTGSLPKTTGRKKSPAKPGFAKPCDKPLRPQVEDKGLEPMTFWLPARRSPN